VLRFDAMREEFLTPRSQFPPFAGIESERLPDNFDYAKYMQTQMLTFLTEVGIKQKQACGWLVGAFTFNFWFSKSCFLQLL
jgi:hypothetical protein